MGARIARRMRWPLRLIVLVLGLSLAACDAPAPRRARPPAAIERAKAAAARTAPSAPQVEGITPVDGAALLSQLKQLGGRGALVNVWASWCGACKREIPMLLDLREAFLPQGLDVLFVSADAPGKWPDAAAFAQAAGLPLPALVVEGRLGPFKRAMSTRWQGAIPASFLFDGDARLRHRWEGPAFEHEIAPLLQAFLRGEDVDGETLPPLSAGRTEP